MPLTTRLPERAVIALSGPDTDGFLQGLISNNMEHLQPDRAIYAALLTPQGKFLFEFTPIRHGEAVLMDVEAARRADLIRRLTMYRLRAKVEIADMAESFEVAAVFGENAAQALGLADQPGACRPLEDGVAWVDPRLATLGGRMIQPVEALDGVLKSLQIDSVDPEAYRRHRVALGVPEGSGELAVERATLLESGFDELHAIDFRKGCFVGQELTARMKYRGLVRKRLLPVTFQGPAPEPGTVVRYGERDAGEIRAAAGDRGLALLRLEMVEKARAEGVPLRAGEVELVPESPAWLVA